MGLLIGGGGGLADMREGKWGLLIWGGGGGTC